MAEWTALLEAIERLYTAFAAYPLHNYVEGCPCCISPSDQATIRAKPLRSLTERDLGRYAAKALTTWGTVADFKHFLPRLLELVVTDPAFNEAILASKLQRGQWHQWPHHEREAIGVYLMALWRYVLVCDDLRCLGRSTDDWLTFIGGIVDELSPFLMLWQDSAVIAARRHLASFVCDNGDMLLRKNKLDSVWWKERPEQMRQATQWLADPQTQDILEQAFFDHAAQPYAEEFAQAADVLRWLRS
jgi:hypothetical protein